MRTFVQLVEDARTALTAAEAGLAAVQATFGAGKALQAMDKP